MTDRACLFGTYAREHSANRLLGATLAAAGYEVVECHVPLWEKTRDKHAGFFEERSLARLGVEYVRALGQLHRQWRRIGPTPHVMVAGFNGQLDVLVARRLVGRRVPVVFAPLVTVTETLVDDRAVYAPASLPARLFGWLDRASLRAADIVITDTEAHAAYLRARFAVPRARLCVEYLGAERAFFTAPAPVAPTARSLLFYGQYVPLHGVETILDAARRLAGRVELVMLGSGPLRVAAETAARGLDNVRFIDWVPYDELPQWIARADVCLGIFGTTPKAAMVVPNKVYQAAAGARPIVTADTPAVREVFRDGESVILIPPGDGAALARALDALAGDPERRAALGRAARRVVEERCDPTRQGRELRACIDAVRGRLAAAGSR
jgi:glycosyltransferase involved in cell wall biosynthesis